MVWRIVGRLTTQKHVGSIDSSGKRHNMIKAYNSRESRLTIISSFPLKLAL